MLSLNIYNGAPVQMDKNGLSCTDKIYRDGKVHDADRIDFLAGVSGKTG